MNEDRNRLTWTGFGSIMYTSLEAIYIIPWCVSLKEIEKNAGCYSLIIVLMEYYFKSVSVTSFSFTQYIWTQSIILDFTLKKMFWKLCKSIWITNFTSITVSIIAPIIPPVICYSRNFSISWKISWKTEFSFVCLFSSTNLRIFSSLATMQAYKYIHIYIYI